MKLNRPLLLFTLLALIAGALLLLLARPGQRHARAEVLQELTHDSVNVAFLSAQDEIICISSSSGDLLRIAADGEERARVSLPTGAVRVLMDELTGSLLITGAREYWLADASGAVSGYFAESQPSNYVRVSPQYDFLLGTTMQLELVGIAWDGRELFRRQVGGRLVGQPRRLGGNYLISTSDCFTCCIDRHGKVLWQVTGQLADISSSGEILLTAGNWLIVVDSAGQPMRSLAAPGIRSASFGPAEEVSYCGLSSLHRLDPQLQEKWALTNESLMFRDSLVFAADGHAAFDFLDLGFSTTLLSFLRPHHARTTTMNSVNCIDQSGRTVWTYLTPSPTSRLLGSLEGGRAVIQEPEL